MFSNNHHIDLNINDDYLNTFLNNINSRVLSSDYNFKTSDINTSLRNPWNDTHNNATSTSLSNNINTRVLSNDYNSKTHDFHTSLGSKANILDNSVTLTCFLNNINTRVLNSDHNSNN